MAGSPPCATWPTTCASVAELARGLAVGEIPGPDLDYAALMAGPSSSTTRAPTQATRGATRARRPGCRRSPQETDLRMAVALARGTGATAIKIYADLPATWSRRSPRRRTARASRSGRTPRSSRRARRSDAASTSVSHVACSPTGPRAPSTHLHGRAADRPARSRTATIRIRRLFDQIRAQGMILDATASLWGDGQRAGEAPMRAVRALVQRRELADKLTARGLARRRT